MERLFSLMTEYDLILCLKIKMSLHSSTKVVTFLFILSHQEELNTRQAEQIVYGILQEILDGIRSPDRPASPVDAYITDEEIFSRKNPGVLYHC